jgi:hypothetical protein
MPILIIGNAVIFITDYTSYGAVVGLKYYIGDYSGNKPLKYFSLF